MGGKMFFKRLFDIVVFFIGIIVFFLLMLFIGIIIKLILKGLVIFK